MPSSMAKSGISKSAQPIVASGESMSRERRTYPRFTTQFRSTFANDQSEGQGRTLDISMSRCKIESTIAVTKGMTFECRLHVPGLDWPLRIDEAVIRWVAGNTFGLEFTRVRPDEQAKLNSVIGNLECEA